jgi:hypothetical protein
MQFNTMVNGTSSDFFRYGVGGDGEIGVIFNEGSIDADFRVESDNDANAFFVEGDTGNVAIGTNDPTVQDAGMRMLHIHNSATDGTGRSSLKLTNGDSTLAASRGAIITLDDAAQLTIGAFESAGKTVFTTGGTTTRMTIDENGHVIMPFQSAFLAQPSSQQSDFASTGNNVAIAFGTERFDQNNDFSSNTFTAPVTGKYQLSANIYLTNIDSAANYYQLTLFTSNRNYFYAFDVSSADADPNRFTFQVNALADMDAGDTSSVMILQVVGTAQTDIAVESYFSGFLAC